MIDSFQCDSHLSTETGQLHNTSLDCGDDIAKKLRGLDLDAVYKLAAEALGESQRALRSKYRHLNIGMQHEPVESHARRRAMTTRTAQHSTDGGPRKRASVYARKSNDDPRRNKGEASESIAMQVENGRAFISAQGWEFVHAYTDDAVSAVNWDKRAAWGALVRDAKAGLFDVLVVRDRSRIVRDLTHGDRQLRALTALGVAIVSYVDGSVIAKPGRARAVDHVIDSVQSFAAAHQREQARDGAREGGCKATRAGHHAGGHVYGYRRRPQLTADGQGVAYVVLEVNEDQARIVRAAFRAYAAGYGFKTIAHALSGHTTPLPSKVRSEFFDGKTALSPSGRKLWSGSSIRDWAHNGRYHGEVTYGVYEWVEDEDPATGKTIKTRRRQGDPAKIVRAEGAAIIDDALWAAVQKRLRTNADVFARWSGGRVIGRAVSGAASIYALSGLLKCGVCGSNYSGNSHKSSTGKKYFSYECGLRGRHGKHGCTTRVRPDKDDIERQVIARLREMLSPAQVEIAIRTALEELRARRVKNPGEMKTVRADIGRLERELANLVEAIAAGGGAALAQAANAKERELDDRRKLLTQLESADVTDFDSARLRRDLQADLDRFHELLGSRSVQKLRQVLVRLLPERLTVEAQGRGWRVTGRTVLGPLIATRVAGLALPGGIEPPFQP